MRFLIKLTTLFFLFINCGDTTLHRTNTNFSVKGLNLVAPPKPFSKDPMPATKELGANWVAVIPYAYTRQGTTKMNYGEADWQWWGEKMEGCVETVNLAKAAELKVMLKPQVYVPGSWTGELDYENPKDWEAWEREYEAYILPMARLAEEKEVELFCFATEFKIGAVKREAFWRALIKKIRATYSGKLIYAANWDNYENIPFWDALDYVGINAYFPLLDVATPRVKDLKIAWQSTLTTMTRFQKKVKRPILFTEFGYLAVDGCAYNTWELESKMRTMPLNEDAQANALDALFQVFSEQAWWHGGFLWKWYPNLEGEGAKKKMDYTPQGKKGEQTLQKWYK